MKRLLLTLIALIAISLQTYAQWTTSGANISNSNTGNVGIGTTTPSSLLHISSNSTGTGTVTTIENTAAGGAGAQLIYKNTLQSWVSGLLNNSGITRYSIYDLTNATERFSILNNGNVGIGTSAPNTPLHINKYFAGIQNQLTLENTYSTSDGGNSIFLKGYYNQALITSHENASHLTGGELQLQTYSDNSTLNTGIVITRLGNVGVGTISPTARLDIFNAPSATPMTGALNFSSVSAGTSFWGFRLAPTTYDFNLDVNDGVITASALTVQRATHNIGIGTTT